MNFIFINYYIIYNNYKYAKSICDCSIMENSNCYFTFSQGYLSYQLQTHLIVF